ncbi:KpsF/GutQ family sugar-phosphate isomerase [Vibrio sp. PNB22_3_1]
MEKCSLDLVSSVLKMQGDALVVLSKQFDRTAFANAIEQMVNCKGHVVVAGMGKSGLIGQKLSATLSSTGTPSFYLHPAEAFHGDLGRITRGDVVVMISNSGETDELLRLLPSLEMFGSPVISITNKAESTLAKHSNATLLMCMEKESCPNGLAPTTSTTLTVGIGDAIAMAVSARRGFQAEDFAKFHPGGSLGRQLLTKVKDVMLRERLPLVSPELKMPDLLLSMTASSTAGIAIIVNEKDELLGVVTDGDIRRAMAAGENFERVTAADLMTSKDVVTISDEAKLCEALALMKEQKVKALVVVDDSRFVQGVLEIHMV